MCGGGGREITVSVKSHVIQDCICAVNQVKCRHVALHESEPWSHNSSKHLAPERILVPTRRQNHVCGSRSFAYTRTFEQNRDFQEDCGRAVWQSNIQTLKTDLETKSTCFFVSSLGKELKCLRQSISRDSVCYQRGLLGIYYYLQSLSGQFASLL